MSSTPSDVDHKSSPSARPLDVAAAVGWAVLAGVRLVSMVSHPSLLQAGLFLFCLLLAVLFVIRSPARAKGTRAAAGLALGATFVPGLVLRPASPGLPLAGEAIQTIGLVLMIVAAASLSRSFGIAPAHRGLVTKGSYAVVRHPLYAAEILVIGGYCVGYASPRNLLVAGATVVAQLLRIRLEERLLGRDAAYAAYRAYVRWRLVPGVW